MQVKFDFASMAPSSYVDHLYSETDENGMLCIPSWNEGDDEDYTLYSCEMTWKKSDVPGIADKCSNHLKTIEDCAGLAKASPDMKDCPDADYQEFWNTYLLRFEDSTDIGNIEDPDSIEGKLFLGKKLTSEEQQKYDLYCENLYRQAEERLGKNNFSYAVLIRSMRYFRLLTLNAPKAVTDNEKRILIEALVFFSFCKSLTKIESIHD